MTPTLIAQIKAAHRVSVPIVAITTPDPAATIKSIVESLNGDGCPVFQWDLVWGIRHLNAKAEGMLSAIVESDDTTIANPVELLKVARAKLPPKTILFMHLAHRLIADPMTIQAAWNLRDVFKQDRRMLVLLSADGKWPAELAGDVVTLEEPLPDAAALEDIVSRTFKTAEVDLAQSEIPKIIEAVQGLPAFQVEQVVAMCLTKKGCDVSALWERKRQQIEQTPGLKVSRDGATFKDIGGVAVIKDFLTRVMHGRARPNAVVFIDEIEKFLAGAGGSGGSDSSGVSQDQLGQLLSYMEDHHASGMIFVGPPGAAKSAVAKAAGNEGGVPTIQLDLGAMKGSLVGASEQNLRAALRVVTSVSNGRSLWIATCNSISDLPPELRRRFTLGTYFFDLPDADERLKIWHIHLHKTGLMKAVNDLRVDDAGWTGAEIRQCCDIAWRLGCTLKEGAAFVVPISRSAAEQLEKLRRAANGRFLSASHPGVYRSETDKQSAPAGRRMEVGE